MVQILGIDGDFTLSVNKSDTLSVSYIGYKTQTIVAQPEMNIKLVADARDDEVEY